MLDAQRSLFAAQQALVQTQAPQVQNLVALYKALGGGWTEPPPPHAELSDLRDRREPFELAVALGLPGRDRLGHLTGVEDRALQQGHLLQ